MASKNVRCLFSNGFVKDAPLHFGWTYQRQSHSTEFCHRSRNRANRISMGTSLESGYVQLQIFVARKVFECFWMLGECAPAPENGQFAVVFVWYLQNLAWGPRFFGCFGLSHNGANWAVCIEYNKQ